MKSLPGMIGLAIAFAAVVPARGQRMGMMPGPTLPNPSSVSVDAVPHVTPTLRQALNRYQNIRTARFGDWATGGKGMYILTRFADVAQVHLVGAPLGARTQLTFLPERILQVLARPGRDQFLYVTDFGGAENGQFYLQNREGGEPVRITDGKSRNVFPKWSRSGDLLAWSSNARNRVDMDLYVAAASDPHLVRILKEVKGDWYVADWSPDGSKVAAVEYVSINESYIWTIDVATGRTQEVTPHPKGQQGEGASASDPKWSADGRSLYYLTDQRSEFRRLVRQDLSSGMIEPISEKVDSDVESFDLSDDGSLLVFSFNDGGFSKVVFVPLGIYGPSAVLRGMKGTISNLKFQPGSTELAFTFSSARTASDAYSVVLVPGQAEGDTKQWTQSETGGLDASTFAEPELITYASFDGRETPVFVYRPSPVKFPGPRPVMILIHGGPESQFRPSFLGPFNYWISELGLVLVFPNVRGSSGYGRSALKADNGLKRMDAVKDIGALFDWIASQPGLDRSRVGVYGGSYGGFMSLAVQTNYNDRIKAGIDLVGISNFVTFLKNTQGYRRDLRRAEYGDERDPEMKAFLERISPLGQAAKIRTPILVVQGRNDPRVPYSEATQMIAALKKNGTIVWTVIGENEGHGFAKKVNQDFLQAVEVMFLRAYLLGEQDFAH